MNLVTEKHFTKRNLRLIQNLFEAGEKISQRLREKLNKILGL